jgi:hypothetical protein
MVQRTRKKRKVLERNIEGKFVKEARALGCLCRKINGLGYASWPDQMVLCPGGKVLLIEFKRPDEELTEAQADLHSEALKIGHKWYWFDNWEDALNLLIKHIK